MAEEVSLEVDGNIATLSLNAPDRRNAITPEMATAIITACEKADANPKVGALIVRGQGKVFCAGAHRRLLDEAGEDPAGEEAFEAIGIAYRSFRRVGHLKMPTIAAIGGAAVGAGLNLALATDLRVIASDARLVSGFLPLGLHPGGGHFALINRTGGREVTAAMGIFGYEISGEEAVQRGLAFRAVPAEEVDTIAREIAEKVARDPALARMALKSFRLEAEPPFLSWDAALEMERASQMWSLRRRSQ